MARSPLTKTTSKRTASQSTRDERKSNGVGRDPKQEISFHCQPPRSAEAATKKEMDIGQGLSFKTAGKKRRRTAKRTGEMKTHKTIAQEMNEKVMEWEEILSKRFHFTASRLAQLRQLLKKRWILGKDYPSKLQAKNSAELLRELAR